MGCCISPSNLISRITPDCYIISAVTRTWVDTRSCSTPQRLHRAQITCLYDMDIVFQSSGNFDEVYLYEELMEADLHAIVSAIASDRSKFIPIMLDVWRFIRSDQDSHLQTPISNPSSTKLSVG